MTHKIAILSDIHGNLTALQAVLEDCSKQGITEYWILGDCWLPGPAQRDIFELLDQLPVTVWIRGNWDDCLLESLDGVYSTKTAQEIYILRLSQYLLEDLTAEDITRIRQLPLQQERIINGLHISISHNLPQQNYGRALLSTNPTENFDALFEKDYDIAVYGHIHSQVLRYSSKGQLILNPGSIGQPFFTWEPLWNDLRAQYAVLEIDEKGLPNLQFRKVDYDIKREYQLAKDRQLPYLELYKELLDTGALYTHDETTLQKWTARYPYKHDVQTFFSSSAHSDL
ncbi:metallophosphoesterase family protein [Streptococcus himalayensis]|uniref:Ser/threonine protein phosphatase n=1 Tax=Streptococcus himalayensis TaxID=1888195 RepID=A0A917A4Q0_9STRE|nr:metallophosphoesterase family protein [Streptococcus himalayensis]GGE26612.1 ser/threonine protein phosphatase [Streptococcus himalayensis]